MTFSIEFKKSALKTLKKIEKKHQIIISRSIKELALNPRPKNCLKLSGSPFYRIRCGDYRIIYDIQDKRLVIIILKIGHRREVYSL